jgi:signal transduction histidine kinase
MISHSLRSNPLSGHGQAILTNNRERLYKDTDRIFAYLFVGQWVLAILIAVYISPGVQSKVGFSWESAVILGGLLTSGSLWLVKNRPGTKLTRYTLSVVQALWSVLLIHLSGGRIETHFHIFGSLAFISFYRDWKLLLPATIITIASYFVEGFSASESIHGTTSAGWWGFLEHSTWIVFEDVFLVLACVKSSREMLANAETMAELERVQETIRQEVELKTTELQDSSKQRETLQLELLQASKLESVGRLASGIAHEINTPIQYVSDSLYFAQEGIVDLLRAFEKVEAMTDMPIPEDSREEVLEWLKGISAEADLDYLRDNLPKALERSTEGLLKVSEIVRSMKMFAHPDQREMTQVDLNEAIKTTVIVCRNEYKYLATIELDLGDLPYVICHAGEVNQVLINLIINAAHAIAEKKLLSDEMGVISIRTWAEGECVKVSVSDTGCGIRDADRDRIFEPFFTTKAVGRGTGQGLTLVHSVIVNKLKGTISIESSVNQGTTFELTIPTQQHIEEAA